MKIMSAKNYTKALKAANESGVLAGFAGMSLILFGGIAVAGVAKNAGNLVIHRVADHKAAKAALEEAELLKKESLKTTDTDNDSEE